MGDIPVPVHVPLNKLECKNTVEGKPNNRRQSKHPHPGLTTSSVHNYNRNVQKSSEESLGPSQEVETGRIEEGK